MRHGLIPSSPATSCFALFVALAVCAIIVVFSWPDPHDRKRAVAPKLVDCCDVRIANTTLFSRRPRVPDSMIEEAKVEPAALR
jgi:hypothetical protein